MSRRTADCRTVISDVDELLFEPAVRDVGLSVSPMRRRPLRSGWTRTGKILTSGKTSTGADSQRVLPMTQGLRSRARRLVLEMVGSAS